MSVLKVILKVTGLIMLAAVVDGIRDRILFSHLRSPSSSTKDSTNYVFLTASVVPDTHQNASQRPVKLLAVVPVNCLD